MAESVVSTAEGASDGMMVNAGHNALHISNAAAWGAESVAVEVSRDNVAANYRPLKDADGAVVITAEDEWLIVPAGLHYRLNVTGHAGNDITLSQHFVKVQ